MYNVASKATGHVLKSRHIPNDKYLMHYIDQGEDDAISRICKSQKLNELKRNTIEMSDLRKDVLNVAYTTRMITIDKISLSNFND